MKSLRRAENVLVLVESLRELHPELARPLTWSALARVFRRERIAVLRLPLVGGTPADVMGVGRYFVITLNSELSPRRHTRDAAHEWGHTKLHPAELGEVDRNLSPIASTDPRELEAQLFAQLLMVGPTATPEHEKIAPLWAALSTPRYKARIPQQLPLELPEKMPVFRALPEPFESEREYQRKIARRGAKRMRRVVSDRPSSDDLERVEFFDADRGTARFTDVAGRRWWVYNYRIIVDGAGKRRWELVRDFMSPDVEFRFFVNSLGRRQVYRFGNRREQRAYRVKHLDRQLAYSVYVPDRKGPTFPTARPTAQRESIEPLRDKQ